MSTFGIIVQHMIARSNKRECIDNSGSPVNCGAEGIVPFVKSTARRTVQYICSYNYSMCQI